MTTALTIATLVMLALMFALPMFVAIINIYEILTED